MNNCTSECTGKCRSKRHVAELISGLSKCSGDVAKKFALLTCRNFWRNFDSAGRNLLLWCSSTGNAELLEFIMAHFKVDLGWKDFESGYTALHRSVLYGQITCTQILMDYGASLAALDHESLTPLGLCQRDRYGRVTEQIYTINGPTELYSMGENMSYNLGHSLHSPKSLPEPIEFFRHANITIKLVKMSKFHSTFLTSDGLVYTCGHGIGGRLGLGGEEATLEPKLVELPDRCVALCCANDHSIFITQTSGVLTCGLNTGKQLGHQPPIEKLSVPKAIGFTKSFREKNTFVGCAAGAYHSAIWTNESLYTFGLNAGQLGHLKQDGSHILSPKLVSAFNSQNFQIVDVVSSDFAMALYTENGNVHLLYQWQVKKILSRNLEIKSLHIIGGNFGDSLVESSQIPLKIAILTKSGTVLLWSFIDQSFRRCVFNGLNRQLYPTDIFLITTGLYLVTPYGNAYRAKFDKPAVITTDKTTANQVTSTTGDFAFTDRCRFLHWPSCYQFGLTYIPAIHRCIRVFSPPDGKNVAFLQQHPAADLTELPMVSPSEMSQNFRNLLDTVNSGDFLHDLVIRCQPGEKWPSVKAELFPCHKYILASRSTQFAKLINQDDKEICVEEIHPTVFSQLLQYIYSNDCDWMKLGVQLRLLPECKFTSLPAELIGSKSAEKKRPIDRQSQQTDPLKLLAEAARKLGVKPLLKRLEPLQFDHSSNTVTLKQNYHLIKGKLTFDRSALEMLADCTIVTNDKLQLSCHRCILSARLEYFNCMFNTGFMESQQNHQLVKLSASYQVMSDVLDYIYTDELSADCIKTDDSDRLCRLLLYSDQFLMPRLREISEVSLAHMVSLKNVADLLDFATTYHADQLKSTCLQFICLNLPAVLEGNLLKNSTRESLDDIGRYYREFVTTVRHRRISPYQSEPSAELISELISNFDASEFGGKSDSEVIAELSIVDSSSQPQSAKKLIRKPVISSPIKESQATEENVIKIESPIESPSAPINIWNSSPQSIDLQKVITEQQKLEAEAKKVVKKSSGEKKTSVQTSTPPRPKPWSFIPSSEENVVSLRDVMLNEKLKLPVDKPKKILKKLESPNKPVIAWQKPPVDQQLILTSTSPPTSTGNLEFSAILKEEKARQTGRQQQEKKSFLIIQKEEKAMEELLLYYRAADNFDEFITVERLSASDKISDPIWKAHVG